MSSVEGRLLRLFARQRGGLKKIVEDPLSLRDIGVAIGSNTDLVTEEYFNTTLRQSSERWVERLLVKLDVDGVI